ncbi:MAG TPA: hypothetical protein VK053_04065 [Jiangellaceae bacterium]|nr:hypothetical protein [Jiangellaceae bacterium]
MTVTGLLDLVDLDLAAPHTWAALPTDPDTTGWEHEIGELLSAPESSPETASSVVDQLRTLHQRLASEPHAALAAWVPRPDLPGVAGFLAVDRIVPGDDGAPVTLEDYLDAIDPDQRTGIRVRSREMERAGTPAGPAIRVSEVVDRPGDETSSSGWVTEFHVIYTIFPPGSRDALELTFCTANLSLSDELDADADAITAEVEVTLGSES